MFEAADSGRNLRVVVDLSVREYADSSQSEVVDLLRGLLQHKSIDRLEYADSGAPPEVPRHTYPGGSAAVGWIEVHPVEEIGFSTHTVIYADGSGVSQAAISGDQARAEILTTDATYAHFGHEDAARRRHDDSVALAAACETEADVLVTERPFLLQGAWPGAGQLTVCDPCSALSLVGLFLRTRSAHVAWATPESGPVLNFNRGLYFWVGTRALLPEGWRWFSHCVNADDNAPTSDITILAQSVFQRVKRALIARDSLLLHMSKQQDNDVAEDALSEMDTILVLLMGAFDALARVAHRAVPMTGSEHSAGWQRRHWRDRLNAQDPALGALVADGTEGADLLEVLRLLRNTVHGASLQPLGLSRGVGRRHGTAVSLPAADALVEVLRRRRWDAGWGLTEFAGGRFHATPDLVIEHVLGAALPLMNAMMLLTPVERLHPAGENVVEDARPIDEPSDPFASRYQRSLRWQLGFP